MAHHHYLSRSRLVGEALRYVAVVDSDPVALLGFASAVLKVGLRDTAIGWAPEQRDTRLRYLVNTLTRTTGSRSERASPLGAAARLV